MKRITLALLILGAFLPALVQAQSAYSIVDTNYQAVKGKQYVDYWDTTYSTHSVYVIRANPVSAFFGVIGGTVTWTASWMKSTGTFNPDLTPGITFLDCAKFGVTVSSPATITIRTDNLTVPTTVYLYIGAVTASTNSVTLFTRY